MLDVESGIVWKDDVIYELEIFSDDDIVERLVTMSEDVIITDVERTREDVDITEDGGRDDIISEDVSIK